MARTNAELLLVRNRHHAEAIESGLLAAAVAAWPLEMIMTLVEPVVE